MSLPNPETDILEQFKVLTQNFEKCDLFDNEIEKFSYKFMKLMNKSEIKKYLVDHIKQRKTNEEKNNIYIQNICKAILINSIEEKSKKKKKKLLKILCEQVLDNTETIFDDPNFHGMMLWKMYQHILNIRYSYKNNRTDLMRIVSEQGAFLCDHLFEAKDKCFWSQDYESICYPNLEETEILMDELMFKQLIRQTMIYNRQQLSKKVRLVKTYFSLLKESGIVSQIEKGKFDIYDKTKTMKKKDIMIVDQFKERVISILVRRLNIVMAKFRQYPAQRINLESSKAKCIQSEVTDGAFLDLKNAFQRCAKKYFYCACSKVNEASVSFMCHGAPNDDDRQNVTLYSHKCELLFYKTTKTSFFPFLNFETTYKAGNFPKLEGAIYPWIFGDGELINNKLDK